MEKVFEDREKIIKIFNKLSKFLIEKNKRYGNSALSSDGVFSKHINEENDNALNGILIRLNDKTNRIKNSKKLRENDIVDIIGYLVLLCINKEWCKDLKKFLD